VRLWSKRLSINSVASYITGSTIAVDGRTSGH
jgi:hypothetical protein